MLEQVSPKWLLLVKLFLPERVLGLVHALIQALVQVPAQVLVQVLVQVQVLAPAPALMQVFRILALRLL